MQLSASDVIHTQGVPGQDCNTRQHEVGWDCNEGLVWEWAKEGMDLLLGLREETVVHRAPVAQSRSQTPLATRSPRQAAAT